MRKQISKVLIVVMGCMVVGGCGSTTEIAKGDDSVKSVGTAENIDVSAENSGTDESKSADEGRGADAGGADVGSDSKKSENVESAKTPDDLSALETADTPDTGSSKKSVSGTKEESSAQADSNVDLKESLLNEKGVTEDQLYFFHQDDFDSDGREEAFAIFADDVDDEFGDVTLVEGQVYFASENKCVKLLDSEGMGFVESARILKLGDTDYIIFDDVYATGRLSYAFEVSGGEPIEAPFSKLGYIEFNPDDIGHFAIVDSTYDAMYDPDIGATIGHTWKNYYFYYDESDGKVHEYGCTEIDADTAKELCRRDIISELIPKGDKVESIYFRDVCQVIFNFSHEEDGYINYYHYIYNLARECLVDDASMETSDEPLEGTVLKAMCPDLATYPDDPSGRTF